MAASLGSSASGASSNAVAITSSLQPISSQAHVIGEKYYFSKTPISNDVAKAAAETVMAIASSALNASKSSSVASTLTVAAVSSTVPSSNACPTSIPTLPVSIISIDAGAIRSEQPEIKVQGSIPVAVTKPVTVLSFVDSKTRTVMPSGTKI